MLDIKKEVSKAKVMISFIHFGFKKIPIFY